LLDFLKEEKINCAENTEIGKRLFDDLQCFKYDGNVKTRFGSLDHNNETMGLFVPRGATLAY
jgi:hypothetical protein